MVHSKSFVVINVDLDVTGQLQTDTHTRARARARTHCISHIHEKNSNYKEEVHQIFIKNSEKVYNSGMGEVLYRILTAFCVPNKIITLIKVW